MHANKILILGIDGMDPRLSKYHMEQGYMPNLKKLVERGAAREDLRFLGAMPTITPPMWTTLATGTYPMTHGITDFWQQDQENLGALSYALDSTLCKAEQIWNVFAESGKKTFVFHWPGSSWPPTSKSENLYVIDGTNPEGICMGTGQIENEYIAAASVDIPEISYRHKAGETSMMCVVTDIEIKEESTGDDIYAIAFSPSIDLVRLEDDRNNEAQTKMNFDVSLSPVKTAEKWEFEIPNDSKELTLLFSGGLIRRPALLSKNDKGIYDTLTIYKNKKSEQAIGILKNGEFVENIIDEAIKNDKTYTVNRNMRILEMAEDGSKMRMWISAAVDIHDDSVFSPKSLHNEIIENVGYPMPVSNVGAHDAQLMIDCMQENWNRTMDWWADTIHYMIEKKGIEIVFSQIHNDDAEKHNFISIYKEKSARSLPMETYDEVMLNISRQNDHYIGRFLHLLDEGWTIFLVSDHGLVVSEEGQSLYYSHLFKDATFMRQWGYTEVKYDEQGNPLPEIDWSKTKAICSRSNSIYINTKGRWATGIVEPKDQEALEYEIIGKLYSLKDEKNRPKIALALRNKDAVLLGLSGPECGDIIVMQAEYNLYDHGDSLSTAIGLNHTSVSPIFVAAGKGIKEGYTVDRWIRQVDLAPTLAILAGIRVPRNCEGAPIYQILADDFGL